MLRRPLLALSRSNKVRSAVTAMPVTGPMVARFVAGASAADAVTTTRDLVGRGLMVTLDNLGEDVTDVEAAVGTVEAYEKLLTALGEADLTASAEVSVKLSALGQALPGDGDRISLEHARRICTTAQRYGTTVTVDMEDHTTTDATLAAVAELRRDFPDTGAVVQAYLHRTEADCRDLAVAGSRVRLCKGAYSEPESVAYQKPAEIDRSYVRCLKVLMNGDGYPMAATHDPRLIELTDALAERAGRGRDRYEHQMLFGIRPEEQNRLVAAGHQMRVYVPYGQDWYGYLVRRLAEKPANLKLFLKSLTSKR